MSGSVASTSSSSHTEPELDYKEYERQRESCVAKVLYSDRKFYESRNLLHKKRLTHIEKLQDDFLNRRNEIFSKRKAELYEEYNSKKMKSETVRSLRLKALNHSVMAERQYAEQNLANDEELARESVKDLISAKFKQLDEEEREMRAKVRKELRASRKMHEQQRKQAKRSEEGVSRYLEKENGKKNGPRLWRDLPAMITLLPQNKLNKDLAILLKK